MEKFDGIQLSDGEEEGDLKFVVVTSSVLPVLLVDTQRTFPKHTLEVS